jgi:hypothetical protein
MRSGWSISKYVAEFKLLREKMLQYGISVDPSLEKFSFLNGLGDEYRLEVAFMRENGNLSVEDCIVRVLAEDHAKKGTKSKRHERDEAPAQANAVTASTGSDVICRCCKKPGHMKKDCRIFQKGFRDGKVVCFRCQSPDHRRKDCPLEKKAKKAEGKNDD